jgi:hypothetical protein
MKTLITAVEEWIDDRVWKASRVAEHEAQFDANEQKLDVLHEQVAELERRLQLYLNSPSPESDGEESTVTELSMRIDDMDSRLDDVESSLEDKIDTCDADEMVDIAVNDIDLESQIIDAVKSEIDAIDFKVTVER